MNLLKLDIHTIILLLFIGNILAVAVLTAYKIGKSRELPYREFMAGKLLQGSAWMLLGLRGNIPDLLSVNIGNAILLNGFSLEALALITVKMRNRWWECVYAVITIIGVTFFWLFGSSEPNIRVGVASLVTIIIYLPASVELIRTGRNSRVKYIIGFICGLFTLFLVFRTWYGFFSRGEFALMTPGVVQTLTFLALYCLMLVVGIGFLLMLKEQNDRQLAESEEKYRTLVEKANEGIIIIQNRKFVFGNSRILEILGLTEDDLIKTDIEEIIYPEDRSMVMDNYERRLKGDDIPGMYDFRFLGRNGKTIWVTMSVSIISWKESPATLALLTDITERKLLEREREKNIVELQRALADVKMLSGLLPICSSCKKIRDDKGYWNQIEVYIKDHSMADFSHSLCPDCVKKLYPEFSPKKNVIKDQ